MSAQVGSRVQRGDPFARLDRAEHLLVQALRLPRRVPKSVSSKTAALRQAIEAEFEFLRRRDLPQEARARAQQAHLQAGEDLVAFLKEQFKEPYIQLKLHMVGSGSRDDAALILSFFPSYGAVTGARDSVPDRRYLVVDNWLASSDHGEFRRMLIEVLIWIRKQSWEAACRVPDPDAAEDAEAVPAAAWERQGPSIVVRSGRLRCTLKEPRLVWLFEEVARCRGEALQWDALLVRRLQHLMDTGQQKEAASMKLEEESLRRYGTLLRKRLGRLGIYWVQSTQEVSWQGDAPPAE